VSAPDVVVTYLTVEVATSPTDKVRIERNRMEGTYEFSRWPSWGDEPAHSFTFADLDAAIEKAQAILAAEWHYRTAHDAAADALRAVFEDAS